MNRDCFKTFQRLRVHSSSIAWTLLLSAPTSDLLQLQGTQPVSLGTAPKRHITHSRNDTFFDVSPTNAGTTPNIVATSLQLQHIHLLQLQRIHLLQLQRIQFLRKLTLQSVFGSHKRKNEEIELKATFTLHSPKNNHSEPTNRERYNKLSSALPLYCVNEVRRCNDFIVTPRDRGQPSGPTRVSGRLLELSGEIC